MKNSVNILLVDDVPANLIALEAVLKEPGYDLVEAQSGFEAIKKCQEKAFALIVLDVQMPGLDGYQTARQIKRSEKNSETPIIFVTATYREDPHIRKGFEAGAVDYFGKPFDPDILRTKVGIYTELYLKTKRLEQTEEFLKTHAQIKTLLDVIPVGIIVCDSEGHIYEANSRAKQIWGDTPQVDLEHFDRYKGWRTDTGESLKSHDWAMARALENGESVEGETIDIETFDGQRKTISNSTFPIRNHEGQILGAIAVIQDVSASKEIVRDIEKKAAEILREVHLLQNRTPSI